MTPQRITLVTLGVADLDRSCAFYGALGWTPAIRTETVVFYQLQGQVLGLFGRKALAEDQRRPEAELGTGAIDAAVAAGATSLKRPEDAFWGGYSGYYADPDGHVWEVAMNPLWTLTEDGGLTLPADPS